MSSIFSAFDRERPTGLRPARATVLAAAAIVWIWPSIVAAQPALALRDAQRLALDRSHQLTGQNSAAEAARHLAVAAGQLPDPVARAGLDNVPVNGPDAFTLGRDFMTMRRVGVAQEFTRGEKRRLRAERFEGDAQVALAEKTAATADIQRDTALAWLDRHYAEAMQAVLVEQARALELELQAVMSAYRGGRGSQADVFAAHSAQLALEDRASELDRRIRAAKAALSRWIGRAAADSPLAPPPAIDAIRLDAAALDQHLAHHPRILVLAAQEQVAATEARLAQANRKSDWSVELAYQQRGSAYSNMVSIGASIPLQWDRANRQDREIAARLAMAEQAKTAREEALRAHIGEVQVMLVEWQNGRERLARYGRDLLPLARERTRAAIAAYAGSKASLAELLAARRNEIDLRMQAVQLEMDTARAWAQLNFLFPDEASNTQPQLGTTGSAKDPK